MTRLQAFKNGRWVHSDTILAIEPDVNFYRVAAGTYAWADTTQPTTYIAADRGLALGVGVTPANWTHDAGAGITVTFRTQSAFAASGAQGGDFIIQAGLGDGVGRRGSFSVPGAGASSEAFGLGAIASGADSLAVGNAAKALAANSVVVGNGAVDGTSAAVRSVVIGRSASNSVNTGSDQVIIGFEAGNGLLGSGQNTILGASAGTTLTTGLSNCLIGYGAETQGVTTSSGVGIGVLSVVGFQSVAIGTSATANGATSVVIGHAAYGGTSAVTDVVVIGDNAANAAFTGIRNVLIGGSVASNLTSGTLNTICGSDAGDLLTTGSSNSLFGFNCETSANSTANSVGMGTVVLVASNSVALGDGANVSSASSIGIGSAVVVSASNQFVAGSSAHPTNNVYFGKGVNNAAPTSYTINGTASIGAAAGGDIVIAGGASASGTGGSVHIATTPSIIGSLANRQDVDPNGNFTFTQGIQTSGSPTFCKFVAAAHTTLLESAEAIDIDFQLNRTVQFDNPGLISDQRAFLVRAPTYAFVAGSTIDKAATVAITGGPIAGTNATITNSYALWIQSGLVQVDGSITVTGSAFTSSATAVLIGNGYPYQNYGYITAAAKTGGVVINYLPTATTDTVGTGGFTAGVPAVSNPSVITAGVATFSASDLIQISGDGNPANNGLFEVLSHVGTTLRIRGIGLTAAVESFTQNQFVTSTPTGAAIVKVGVSVIRAGTDGIWETGRGNVTPIAFTDTGTGTVLGTVNRVAKFTAATVVGDSSITDTGALVTVSVPLTVPGVGANSERFGAATTANAANSVVIGYSANGGTAAATNGVVIGDNAANVTFSGIKNVLIGTSVSTALDTGTLNTICGSDAGDLLTTGNNNCLYGYNAETYAVGTADSVGIGYNVVVASTSVAIGSTVTANADESVVIGYLADGGTAAATNSIVIGTAAGNVTFTGIRNVLIGRTAASALTSGTLNTICGADAGNVLTTGSNNCLYGYNAETVANSTADAVGIGYNVIVGATSVSIGSTSTANAANSVVIGYSADGGTTAATGVTVIGANAGNATMTGADNILVGSGACFTLTSGAHNIIVGSRTDGLTTGGDNVVIGDSAAYVSGAMTGSVLIGTSSAGNNYSVSIGYQAECLGLNSVMIGGRTGKAGYTTVGANLVVIGYSAGSELTSGTLNTIVGSDAGDVLTTGSSNCLYGNNAETVANSVASSVGIGAGCLVSTQSVVIGASASVTGNNNVVVGNAAGNVAVAGTFQVIIGDTAGTALTSGTRNTIIGGAAGTTLTTGGNNVVIGFDAETTLNSVATSIAIGVSSITGNNSIVIGASAVSAGQNGVVIGSNAGNGALNSSTQVIIGYSAASALSSGAANTIVGAEAGDVLTTGTLNVLIGSDCETAANVSSNSVGVGASVIVATSSVALGTSANVSQTDSIGLGHNVATTASNQFVAGSNLQRINNVYFGKGVNNAAPTSYTINGTASTGAAAGGDIVIAGGVSAAGVGGSVKIQTAVGAGLADRQVVSPDGNFTFTQAINTTGSPTFALWTGAAHTTLTASVEACDVLFDLSRTVQFATGALTTQRAFVVENPTYAFVAASTITTAATFAILGAPVAGANATITDSLAFWVQAGKSQFADHVTLLSDSAAVRFGAGTDMSVYYNGTNGIINTSLIAASDLTITCGAQKTFVLTNTVYNDANVGGATLRGGTTNPPITQIVDNVGTNTGIYALGFDLNDEANGCIEIPHDYAEGTNLVFHVHWFGNDAPAGGTDNVKWQVTYSVCRDGVTTPPATTPAGTEVAYTTQYSHVRTDLATINGASFKIGDQVHFNVKRIAASADDYAGLTLLDTAGFHYQCDTMGSRQATVK